MNTTKKYRVYVKPSVKYYEVEARNEKEAQERAFEMYDYHDGDFLQFIPKAVKRFTTFKENKKLK